MDQKLKKAIGFPITPDRDNCTGICLNEDGHFLGTWTSSNYSWLSQDLKKHATGYEYEFKKDIPDKDFIIYCLLKEIYRLKETELKNE